MFTILDIHYFLALPDVMTKFNSFDHFNKNKHFNKKIKLTANFGHRRSRYVRLKVITDNREGVFNAHQWCELQLQYYSHNVVLKCQMDYAYIRPTSKLVYEPDIK